MPQDYLSDKNTQYDTAATPSKDDRVFVFSEDLTADSDSSLHAGGLTFEEDTAGGMGRHLGVFSCTMLMLVRNETVFFAYLL
jgi:hypothetical protein